MTIETKRPWFFHENYTKFLEDGYAKPSWQTEVSEAKVSVLGIERVGEIASVVQQVLDVHRLGRVSSRSTEGFVCDVYLERLATELVTATLFRSGVPRECYLRSEAGVGRRERAVYVPDHWTDAPAKHRLGLRYLRRSRKRPVAGTLFCFSPREDLYGFGRVVRDDVLSTWSGETFLLNYFYSETSSDPGAVPPLSKDRLACPPWIDSDVMWRLGAFQTLEVTQLESTDLKERHAFYDRLGGEERFYDEYMRPTRALPEAVEVGVPSTSLTDLTLCNAFGVPGVPAWHPDANLWRPTC